MTDAVACRAVRLLAFLLILPLPAVAKPTVSVREQWVSGTVELSTPYVEVMRLLEDPRNVGRWDGRGATITPRLAGECGEVDVDTPSPIGRLRYTERRCRTADGWHSILLRSEDFDAYESRWVIQPREGGCSVLYELHTRPSVPVPGALLDRLTVRAVRRLLQSMSDTLGSLER